MSINSISAHWEIPEGKKAFMQELFWAVEERAEFVGKTF